MTRSDHRGLIYGQMVTEPDNRILAKMINTGAGGEHAEDNSVFRVLLTVVLTRPDAHANHQRSENFWPSMSMLAAIFP